VPTSGTVYAQFCAVTKGSFGTVALPWSKDSNIPVGIMLNGYKGAW